VDIVSSLLELMAATLVELPFEAAVVVVEEEQPLLVFVPVFLQPLVVAAPQCLL
jgi:hypothetical protein